MGVPPSIENSTREERLAFVQHQWECMHIAVDHLKASAIGEEVRCTAMLLQVDGRAYEFMIEVLNGQGEPIAKAEHIHFRVNSDRFMAKLQ